MTAHRVQPQMMGITPSNVGGFDDVEKASLVFFSQRSDGTTETFTGVK